MKIDKTLLDDLSARASKNPRLREAYDLRTSPEVASQRMLNAIEPGTVLPIHRHRDTAETIVVVRGRAEELFYDDNGNITERVMMAPNTDCYGVHVEAGRWHSIVSLEPGTVIVEGKDGAYFPLAPEDILTL